MKENYNEPVFLISVAAKILNIHPQTLRQYEKEGLIEPSRTCGKMRLYSQKDIDKIKNILTLTRELGVNLAGVEIILNLQEQIYKYEVQIKELQNNNTKNNSLVKKPNFDIIFV